MEAGLAVLVKWAKAKSSSVQVHVSRNNFAEICARSETVNIGT
jgi:hypothetical protein